jgi:polyisoprenoid-binding protein YceI
MSRNYLAWFVCPLLMSLSASCADSEPNVAPEQAPHDAPESFPFNIYQQAEGRGEVVYAIDSVASTAVVRVSRAGFLAVLGHDHVVASHDVIGYALLPDPAGTLSGARADLYLPVAGLVVDEAELRKAAGMDTAPSAKDIEDTRTNMFKSLDAATYPWLMLNVLMLSDNALFANLTLEGVKRSYRIPVQIEFDDETLQVTGEFTLRQTDHGIKPFRALGGALSVADELAVRFELIARKSRR